MGAGEIVNAASLSDGPFAALAVIVSFSSRGGRLASTAGFFID